MASAFGPMTLGELIDALEATYKNPLPEYFEGKQDKERCVYIDWCHCLPENFHSYRGYYDHLGLTFRSEGTPEKVKDFLARCKDEVGAVHGGWKGGEYKMGRDTPVWVSETGANSHWGIVAVKDCEYYVELTTDKFD